MKTILITIGIAVLLLWGLALFYFAVMNIKRVRDRGELTKFMLIIGLPMLWIGLILDLLVNVFIFSILFLEVPQEPLVTGRLKRHKYHGTGWRHRLALFWEKHIDPFDDKPGGHI
jgi:ABC-type dipeptide/oligopeptide/nickel transport system permease component